MSEAQAVSSNNSVRVRDNLFSSILLCEVHWCLLVVHQQSVFQVLSISSNLPRS